jgi:hypothetical protein
MAQQPQPLYVTKWETGLYTQRSPLVSPTSALGLHVVPHTDALIDGLNIELSSNNTLVRRPGFTKYCSAAFGAGDWPLNFFSFRNIAGTIRLMVDTPTKVYTFTTGAITAVFTKTTTAQTFFQTVANMVYFVNGTDLKKWDGTTVSGIGIAAPATAPTITPAAGSLSPTSGYRYVYAYKNSSTGHVGTSSPVSASTGPQTSKQFGVGYTASADAQVDKINIFRTLDGGSIYYFLIEVANATSSYTDTTTDANLNTAISAPINHANDPLLAGASNLVFHLGRLFAAINNKVYFAGGGDTLIGVPEEAWPPANVFVFPGKINAMASTSQGLVLWTDGDSYIIRGADASTFYSQKWLANFGASSQNCVAQDGDLVFVYTNQRQLWEIGDNLEEIGFPIGDQLLSGFDPTVTRLALHRAGSDVGLFIANGTTDVYRYNVAKNSWSTKAQPVGTGGVLAIASIATTTSDYRLMMGRTVQSRFIMYRDVANWQDEATNYSGFATVGTLVLAPLGGLAGLSAILIERVATGTDMTVSVMLNEIAGSFTTLPNPVSDPPMLTASTTIIAKRHYLKSAATPLAQKLRHLQVKITLPTENAKNEILSGALLPLVGA